MPRRNRMVFHSRRDDPAGALAPVVAVVVDPGFTENLTAEPAVPFLALPTVAAKRRPRLGGKGVRGRPQTDDGPARFDVIDDVSHLLIGQLAKTREKDHQIGRPQRFEAGRVVVPVGVDRSVMRIDRKEHRAFETMPLSQNLGQLRQPLFRPVLLVAADEDDVLAVSGARSSLENEPRLLRHCGNSQRHGESKHNTRYGQTLAAHHGSPLSERVKAPA